MLHDSGTFWVTAVIMALAPQIGLSNDRYLVAVEREADGAGVVTLFVDGLQHAKGTSLESPAPELRIEAKSYSKCSATWLAGKRSPGVFIPDDQTQRKGIFIRESSAKDPRGSIALPNEDMTAIWEAISPKDGKNVDVVIVEGDAALVLGTFRKMVDEIRKELAEAKGRNDKKAIASVAVELSVVENIYYLQLLAAKRGVIDKLVKSDPLLSRIPEKIKDAGQKFIAKKIVVQLLNELGEKLGARCLGSYLNIVYEVVRSDELGKDPSEVLRDDKASPEDVELAVMRILRIERNKFNTTELDNAYEEILSRLLR